MSLDPQRRAIQMYAALNERHEALLERVTMLERTIEQARDAMNDDWLSREARTGVHPRHEIRRLLEEAFDA